MRYANTLMWVFFSAITIALMCLAIYKLYFWFDAWRLSRMYTAGETMAPDTEEIEMDDGRLGHAITFYGEDGNSVFIKELNQSYLFTGGIARIEVADSSWFSESPEDVEAAIITMTPILETENGGQSELPSLTMTVDVPKSPLTLINPSSDYEQVVYSMYPLQIQVVPGSEVLVNGENVTDVVDYTGLLSANISIGYGDNEISILVSTPNHRQTRQDIVLYREPQEIAIEPSLTLEKKSNKDTMTISGKMDPSATLAVDTPYVENSIKISQNGEFSFKAKFSEIGENIVTFRAQKPGFTDSVLSVTVNYVPTLDAYSRKAWPIDWDGILLNYRNWQGQEFVCIGPIVEIIEEDDTQLLVINAGTESEPKPVVLENASSVTNFTVGSTYKAYADIAGNASYFYNDVYCPRLTMRYLLTYQESSG